MFKKILLPLDVSNKHGRVLEVMGDLTASDGGEVTLLPVIEVIAGISMEEEKDFYQRLEKTARRQLGKIVEQLKSRKLTLRTEVLYGNREAEIVRYAREAATDLIILMAPQFDPNNVSLSLGSLSYKISLFAPCPVLLVK